MTSGTLGLAVQTVLALIAVLGLVVLAGRLARRAGRSGEPIGLRVVERAVVSRDASVAVVEVAGRGLVLGVTAAGVSLLTQLDAEQLAAARVPSPEQPSVPVNRRLRSALEALRSLTARRG